MTNYAFPYPFLPVSGKVIDANASTLRFRDLTDMAGSISVCIYDQDTQAIATGSGNGTKFFIGYSSEHTKDFIDKYLFGNQVARGNNYWGFKGSDVISFEYSDPTYTNSERWVWGWSGTDGCNKPLPKFLCGKPYGIRIRAYGNEVGKRWNGDFVREYYSDPIKCSGDTTNCVNGVCPPEYVDPYTVVKSIATKINNDFETKQLHIKARVINADYTPTIANMHIYQLIVSDDGSDNALAAVQKTVPKPFEVSRVNRVGIVSVYEACAATSPAVFQPDPNGYFTKNCNGCEETLSNATYYDVYKVVVTVGDAGDIDTEGERTSLINSTTSSYSGTNGTYVSHNGTELVFTFRKAKGAAAPTPAGNDVITQEPGQFTLTMPSTISWTQKCDAYRTTRNLCITLPRKDCTAGNRLAELKAFYASYPLVDADNMTDTGGNDCEDTYQVTQYSKGCMTDSCLAADTPEFDDLGAYEDAAWQVVTGAVPAYDADTKVGLEISINFPKKAVTDDDEYNPWEHDDDLQPTRLEVTVLYDPFSDLPDFSEIPIARRVTRVSHASQTGGQILRSYIKANAYMAFGEDYNTPEYRKKLGSNLRKQVDRTSPYRVYYLKFKVNRGNVNFHQKGEIVEIPFAISMTRPDKMAKLEAAILSPLSKFGVTLQKRDI